jgi:glutaredoxin
MSNLDNPLDRRILELFDELGKRELDLHALLELAGAKPPAEREAVLDRVTALVERKLLRPAGGSDFYARTEAGRLALAGPLDLTLYTRADCRLCEQMKRELAPLVAEAGARLTEVDIDADPDLRARYTDDVPVLLLGAREVARHRLDAEAFRRELASPRG